MNNHPRTTPQARLERGFTLLEMMIAASLVLVLAYLVMTMSKTGVEAQDYAQRMRRVTEIAQEITESMREDAQSSVRLFSNDTNGNAYRNLLDFSTMPAALSSGRLPIIGESGVFETEASTGMQTGNSLLLARFAWSDEFQTTSSNVYRIDTYRLVYYYLTLVGGGPRSGSADGLDLVRWVSEPLADGNQIDNIPNSADRDEVCDHLRLATADRFGETHPAVQVVWKVGEDTADVSTLRQITNNGVLVDDPAAPRPPGNWAVFADGSRASDGMLAYRNHSVASNFAPKICGVARYGQQLSSGAGFPHGLEIQIIGPASARQILTHLTIVSTKRGRLAHHRAQVIADARDL